MTWTTDGSGLQVKRIRGRTMPQYITKEPTRVGPTWTWKKVRQWALTEISECRAEKIADRDLRRYKTRVVYRSVQRRAEPRALRRRVAHLALESTARDLGLEVRLGEFSRDLRARIGAAQLRAVAATILRPTYERMTRDLMTRGFLQEMEPPLRDTFAESLGLKVTETPDATVVLYPSEGGTVDELRADLQITRLIMGTAEPTARDARTLEDKIRQDGCIMCALGFPDRCCLANEPGKPCREALR